MFTPTPAGRTGAGICAAQLPTGRIQTKASRFSLRHLKSSIFNARFSMTPVIEQHPGRHAGGKNKPKRWVGMLPQQLIGRSGAGHGLLLDPAAVLPQTFQPRRDLRLGLWAEGRSRRVGEFI